MAGLTIVWIATTMKARARGSRIVLSRRRGRRDPGGGRSCVSTGAGLLVRGARFFEKDDIRPRLAAEFEDAALMKAVDQENGGGFPALAAIAPDVCRERPGKSRVLVPSLCLDF